MLRHTLPFLTALTLPALALAGPGGGPCKDDAKRLCADQIGDRAAVKACLETHRADLSEACQTRLDRKAERKAERKAAREATREAVQAACAADRARLCPDAEPGKPTRKCMRRNADQLSEGCAAALQDMKSKRGWKGDGDGPRGKRGKHMRACKADAERLCAEHKGDREAMRACLTEHAADLSPDCAAARERMSERRGNRHGNRQGRRGPPAE